MAGYERSHHVADGSPGHLSMIKARRPRVRCQGPGCERVLHDDATDFCCPHCEMASQFADDERSWDALMGWASQ